MKVLVLGANSFSGKHFIEHCLLMGDDVKGLSRPHDFNVSLPDVAARLVNDGYRHVANFIALNVVDRSWDKAPEYYRTNVASLARLADLMREAGVEKFLQVSTPEVYGTTGTILGEGAQFNPSTPYAVSRAAADLHLRLLHRQFGFPAVFTRTVNVYGTGQQPYRIVPRTISCAKTGERLQLEGRGISTRSFIHIRDAARAYRAVLKDGSTGEDYHIATPDQVRICDLVLKVCNLMGKRFEDVVQMVPERRGKDLNYHLDDRKIRATLGWSEAVSLDEGLKETIRDSQ